MNYYEHHIGDFAQATAHLSFVEDAAYSRLIRKYYAEERPLPADIKAVQRLTGARAKEERQAIADMLQEFFQIEEDGWHNKRCDAEIARYRDKQEKARASAQARWDKQPGKRKPSAMRTHSENDANASGEDDTNAMRTHCEGNAHQAPGTKHQTPEVNPEDKAAASVHPAAAFSDPLVGRAIELTAMLRHRGADLQASDPRVRSWAESGLTDAQALAALEIAQERRAQKADPRPINAGFIDSILPDVLKAKNARASPAAPRSSRQNRIDNYAAEAAAARGENEQQHSTGRTERDITGESIRIA